MRERRLTREAGIALALAQGVDPDAVDVESLVSQTQALVQGADRLLTLGLRDVHPGVRVTPGEAWT